MDRTSYRIYSNKAKGFVLSSLIIALLPFHLNFMVFHFCRKISLLPRYVYKPNFTYTYYSKNPVNAGMLFKKL